MITDRPGIESDIHEKEFLNSARIMLEEAMKEKNIIPDNIEDCDKVLLMIGHVYENLVTMQRLDDEYDDYYNQYDSNLNRKKPDLKRIK